MKHALVDTGFIVSLLDRSQATHNIAKEILVSTNAPLITCEPVIAEACYLLRNTEGANQALMNNLSTGILQIPWHLATHERTIATLLTKYVKVPMDFADACLVCMADVYHTDLVLTFDSDFAIYRWHKSKPFKINGGI